jgi:transketolase
MEGISHEACSLAGRPGPRQAHRLLRRQQHLHRRRGARPRRHPGLVPGRHAEALRGLQLARDPEGRRPRPGGHQGAIEEARSVTDKPTLICCQTIIGFGSPNKQGKEECHGAPLGDDEIALTRENLGWSHAPFEIPERRLPGLGREGARRRRRERLEREVRRLQGRVPAEAAEFKRRMAGELPEDFDAKAWDFIAVDEKAEKIATRKASQNALNGFGPMLPELLGGSADLAGSNLTIWSGCKGVSPKDASGNYVYYGVREFGMSAIMNGITLHGGFKPYGATFLMFMEYARNAVRMAALMKINPIFVYTHDSIGLGEDGPTHQPVEQVPILRLTPRMSTWRPCDAVESAVAWKAIQRRAARPR